MTHTLGIIVVTTAIVLCTLLPFLPGAYDNLAETLSAMARTFGVVGLFLVPVGGLWVASRYWSRLAGKQHGIAIAALIASTIVWLAVSLPALIVSGASFCFLMLAFGSYLFSRALPALTRLKTATARPASAVASYLLIVPVSVALLQLALIGPAIESSRNRAILNSAPFIAEIEQYRAAHGRYPASLLSVNVDHKPGVIGIKEYLYEPSGDAYNLVFEQIARAVGTREFVVYNPRDEQTMTSHKFQSAGHYAVRDAPYPHWKYFWFD